MDFINLGDGTDVARDTRVDFNMLATLYFKQVTNLEWLSGITDEKL